MARRGVNKVILIGNIGADPELRYTPKGTAVTNFNMATNENWTDSSGERQERTEWHRVVVWGRLAEICNQYLRKGSKVYIEGRLQTRSWEGQDGQKRYTTEVVARDMQMLDSREDIDAGGGFSQGPGGPTEGTQDVRPGSEGTQDVRPGSEGTQDVRPGSEGTQDVRPGSEGTQDVRPGSEGTGGGPGTGSGGSSPPPYGADDDLPF